MASAPYLPQAEEYLVGLLLPKIGKVFPKTCTPVHRKFLICALGRLSTCKRNQHDSCLCTLLLNGYEGEDAEGHFPCDPKCEVIKRCEECSSLIQWSKIKWRYTLEQCETISKI